MRAGKLRDYITVEMQAVTPDAYGNVGGAWSARGSFWADVRVTPGKERIEGGTLETTAMATVRLRVSTEAEAITAGDRMVFRGKLGTFETSRL